MKHTLAVIFLACIAQAGQLEVTAKAMDSKPAAAHLDFAGVLTFPGFNPSLGTLTSINVTLTSNATLTFRVTQPNTVKYTAFSTPAVLHFLGARVASGILDQIDLPPRSPCDPCPLVVTDIGRSGLKTVGTITPDNVFQLSRGGPVPPGKSSVPFSAFVGGEVSLPVSTGIEPTVRNIVGNLTGGQKIIWNLAVTYVYR